MKGRGGEKGKEIRGREKGEGKKRVISVLLIPLQALGYSNCIADVYQ